MCTRMRMLAGVLAAAALISLAACGDDDVAGPSTLPNPVIMLKNEANVPITSVNIAQCSDETWGENRLPGGQTITTGATRTFGITPGCWDVRASTGQKFGTWWDYEVSMGDTVRLALSSAASSLMTEVPDRRMKVLP